jgi:eukaryotic-like serine/threonine-protein kinase
MNADHWKQVDALLDAAMDLPAAEREQFVLRETARNPQLQQEVLSLIKAQSQAGKFMERSAMRVAAQNLAHDANLTVHESLIGKTLGDYRIERQLGSGGMGEVYQAHDLNLNRKVALKILPRHLVADVERTDRFKREAFALSALNHPALITIYEVGESDGVNYIAMELVNGQTLRSKMNGGMSLKESLAITSQVAEALAGAHQAGVLHRDIKPDNIMVREDGYVKLLDFGLAKLTEAPGIADAAQTRAGVAMGTLAYMSPEQASGEAMDHRTDIWSLGVVLYETTTGRKPFDGGDRRATVNAILSGDFAPAGDFDANLPAELDSILDKALEKERDLRYQTAADFHADLKRLRRTIDSASTSTRQRTTGRSRAFTSTRKRLFAGIAALAVLAIVGVILWVVYLSRPGTPDWSRARQVQLTDQPGTEYFPSLAPDGNSFVYATRISGNLDLVLQRVGGRNTTVLTPNTSSDESEPAFSPSGDRIAFRSNREPAGIYIMEATGENVRLAIADGHHPSWSPDGAEIVYSTIGREVPATRTSVPSALWVVNLKTGTKRLLTQTDAIQPSWSPHGQRIAYWFMPPNVGRSDIATIPSGGGEPVVVTRDAATNWNPVWSPDGKFLYFASDRKGNMSFWRVEIDEATGQVRGDPEAVATPSTFNRHLSFSRDGKRLLYVQTSQQSNIRAVGFDPKSGKTSGEFGWITRGDRQISRPELSPDGQKFVMRLQRRSQDDLVIVDRDGTNWRDITNDQFFDRYPRWSPDGRSIAFASDRSGNYEIWTINADGSNLRQLTFDSERGASFPLWSPDGKQMLFRRNFLNYIINLDKAATQQTGELVPNPEGETRFVAWDWSPDGQKLVGSFNSPTPGIGYYSFAERKYERLGDFDASPVWLSDNRRFIFLAEGKAYIGDIVTKVVRPFFDAGPDDPRSLGIARDDSLLYFSVHQSESDIWLLDLRQ